LARDQQIDEATVDVELAWEARAEAERVMEAAEVAAGTAVERLLGERLSVAEVVELTWLGQPTVRATPADRCVARATPRETDPG
jgi:hypothetical protein